jgi:hypothetical protein
MFFNELVAEHLYLLHRNIHFNQHRGPFLWLGYCSRGFIILFCTGKLITVLYDHLHQYNFFIFMILASCPRK